MKVLMLGWEYPPHISGGLGTACKGLTTALAPLGVEIDFVVPRAYGDEDAPHMHVVDAARPWATSPRAAATAVAGDPVGGEETGTSTGGDEPAGLRTVRIPTALSPYMTTEQYEQVAEALNRAAEHLGKSAPRPPAPPAAGAVDADADVDVEGDAAPAHAAEVERATHYSESLFGEVERYAELVASLDDREYDVIHAHDWMTFAAGVAAKARLDKPLVVHVHSLEYDRSGEGGNPGIVAAERAGLLAADRVIAVSHYTRTLIHRIHGIALDDIDVVHNGVYQANAVDDARRSTELTGPVVLFLGRVTFQKGPEYFVEAAARVIPRVPNVQFVMAGSGDMLPRMIELSEQLGVRDHFHFPGFLRGAEVEHVFSIADVYVMPSVSEPFGISALEAMAFDKPVIISRQSGVAELLQHALKVDFWDVELLASKIISLLTYPELRESIVEMAREEVRRMHWDAAAKKTVDIYGRLITG